MPNIPNINLKYLAITIILLSFLMVGGVYLFGLINKPKLPIPNTNQTQNQATQSAEPNKSNPTEGGGGHGKN